MEEKNSYKKLALLAKEFDLLYVEDNLGLQKQAAKIFKKFFKNVMIAKDAEEGLELFRKYAPKIIISDIKMPKMNGLDMSAKIKSLQNDTKIVITSAFDEKEYLLKAIDIGISKYLKKPIPIGELVDALIEIIEQINSENNKKLFDTYVEDTFEHQDIIVILIRKDEVLAVNKKCLDFFAQESLDNFREFFKTFSKQLIPYKNFLSGENWLNIIKQNRNQLFNAKIDKRHFVLKGAMIPKKDDYYIISLDDITELGLLEEENLNLGAEEQKLKMINLLHVLKRNNSIIRLFNSYKGLSISNTASIEEVTEEHITIKTTYLQQRAIHIDKKTIIESELLPKALECDMKSINFETQIVELNNFHYISTLPSNQKFVRVMPEATSIIEIFYNTQKLMVNLHIVDISLEGCSISLKSLPADLKIQSELFFKLKLGADKSPLSLSVKGRVLRIKELKDEFRVVAMFELKTDEKKQLVDYIARRQMALIREFKGLQNAR